MDSKEIANLLYGLYNTQAVQNYSRCYEMAVSASKQLKKLSENPNLAKEGKIAISKLNTKIVSDAKEILSVMGHNEKEKHCFCEYMKTLNDPLDRDILYKRYILGHSWDLVESSIKKARSTIFKRHKRCMIEYLRWRDIYVSNGN